MIDSPDEAVDRVLPRLRVGVLSADDFSSATFKLRDGARFHDGKPITPEDVIFSLDALKKANPRQAAYYKNVVKAEKTGDREVTFRFDQTGNRELPTIVGQLPRPAQALLGRRRTPNGEPRDLGQIDARSPARLRPLPHQVVRCRPHHRVRARQGLVGEGSAGRQGPVELRRDAVHLLPRQDAGIRGLQGRPDRLLAREQRQGLGDRATTSTPSSDGRVKKEAIARRSARADAGLRASTCAATQFQDPRVRQAFNLRVRFRVRQQEPVLRPVHARRTATSATPSCRPRACRRGANWRS